jgi:hypothetical protein
MESKLLKGARSIEDYTSEQEKALKQHQLDLAAQQRREECDWFSWCFVVD